jgi:membrane protein involved in colicin uptake
MFAYCINNPINLSDSAGDRPVFDSEEFEQQYNEWVQSQKEEAARQYTLSQMKDLGYKKWKYRRDPADESTRENDHVHLKGDGQNYQQDEFGNRRKGENSPGDPPRKAKEALKQKEGWDWDAKASKAAEKKIVSGAFAIGGGYVVYRVIRILPSLAPPLWWTMPVNIAIP